MNQPINKRSSSTMLALVVVSIMVSCSPALTEDEQLQQKVEMAIAAASDLPSAGLAISASAGQVTISGSLECEDCGGMRTPGGLDTIQQSLGAVVRAVPGVEAVEFSLQ